MWRQANHRGGNMNASVKKYAAAVGLRKMIGIIAAAMLVAAAAIGWEKTTANAGASSEVASTVGGGHYKLQPLW